MPSGRTHTTATLAATPVVALAAFAAGLPVVPAALGCLSAVLLSPDLDVDGGYIGVAYLRKVSPLLAFAWRVYWWPYAKILGHRSRYSHLPGLGTALRLAYVSWPFALFGITASPEVAGAYFLGLCVGDTLHALMDVL